MPSTDHDVVMKPLPATLASSAVKTSNEELVEQYRSPKRRYRELEEKHDETSQGLERSDERNVRMREERSQLLDTINSLEKQHPEIQDLGASSSQQNTVTNEALSEYAQRSGGTLPGNILAQFSRPPSSSTSPSLNSSTLLPQRTNIGNTDEPSAPTQKPDIPSPSTSVAGSSQNGKQKASEGDEAGVATTSKPPASGPSRNMRRSTRLSTTTDHELAKTSSEPPKTRKASIPMVPRDKQGKPMLPLNVGIMTVISLGEVCLREHFHTERYIFPVGFEVTRRYLSTINPNIEVVYHCTILDGGDGPKFQIVPSDVPDRPIIAGTATGAWSSIVKQANSIRNRQHSNSVSGPDFFGLGQNTIKHLIQELPNADRLRDYVWQTFIEGGPLGGRHAAVIPALPEEYDSAMPIGAYYPTASELEKRKRETGVHAQPPSSNGISYYPQHIIAQAEAQRQQSPQQIQESNNQPLPTEGATSVLSSPLPHIDVNLMNLEHFHAQLANSAEQTPQGSDAGARPQSGTPVSSVPATIVGIMQALQPVAGSGASTPAPAQ
ncbi:hypothetical protein H0H93_004523 [Arthromyces matolae]|nr:hypothetical protein H0H93_004523 [Arthromyces matolae]